MSKQDKTEPITVYEYIEWQKRDLYFLEGLGAGMDSKAGEALRGKIQAMKKNLMSLQLEVRESENGN